MKLLSNFKWVVILNVASGNSWKLKVVISHVMELISIEWYFWMFKPVISKQLVYNFNWIVILNVATCKF